MEINNRTVRLLSQTNNFTDENLWSFFEENFDLKLVGSRAQNWLRQEKSYRACLLYTSDAADE